MVLFYKTKNVTDMLQHGKNTCFCSRGQNMPLICCSIVKIHGSVPSDEKKVLDMLQHGEKAGFYFCSMG